MFLSDPSLYGLNLPYRDITAQTPFFPNMFGPKDIYGLKEIGLQTPFVPGLWNLPVQAPMGFFPWQNVQRFVPPMLQTPFQAPFQAPFQTPFHAPPFHAPFTTPWNFGLPFTPYNMVRPFDMVRPFVC